MQLPAGSAPYLFLSDDDDVYRNLAREELLFDALPEGARALLLYIDAPSIVIGKHQNPWRECSVPSLKRRGIRLARRISGGGAVYHDLGNLNFSLLMPKRGFDRRGNLAPVVRALRRTGIEARVNDRHDISAGGRKVSGNAFCFRHERALHHGTLLVHAGIDGLRDLLTGLPGIETFAVASTPSPVVNLSELAPGLAIDRLRSLVVEEVALDWGLADTAAFEEIDSSHFDEAEVASLAERNRTDEWLYGRTPKFAVRFDLPRGILGEEARALELSVEGGRLIDDPIAGSDDLPAGMREHLSRHLSGLPFDAGELSRALASERGFEGLASWFGRRDF